ncbi:Lysine-specific demethylase jmj30 [Dionaea muscipula]
MIENFSGVRSCHANCLYFLISRSSKWNTVLALGSDANGIFFQVVGKKYVWIYLAFLSEELYPHDETMLCNSSQVDLDNADEETFPKVRNLEFHNCILDEGEML